MHGAILNDLKGLRVTSNDGDIPEPKPILVVKTGFIMGDGRTIMLLLAPEAGGPLQQLAWDSCSTVVEKQAQEPSEDGVIQTGILEGEPFPATSKTPVCLKQSEETVTVMADVHSASPSVVRFVISSEEWVKIPHTILDGAATEILSSAGVSLGKYVLAKDVLMGDAAGTRMMTFKGMNLHLLSS